jgi:uncharacterized membrane protein
MKIETFKKIKILTTSFVAATVAIAVTMNNALLAISGVLIGILFLSLVKKKAKMVFTDEMIQGVSEKAARLAYLISTVFIAFLSLLFVAGGSRDSFGAILGAILSYIALLNLAIYSISYNYYLKKYGVENE